MRHWGFEDARAQPGGADGGVDVVSRRALGQVKFQASAVGRPELQRLFGARGKALDKQLLFFTGSSYAATAVEYARENDIALFVYGLDGAMRPVNGIARRISAVPSAGTSSAGTSSAVPAAVRDAPGRGVVQDGAPARPRPASASAAPPHKSAGRTAVIAFLVMGALGGLVSAVEGLTGHSLTKEDSAEASAGPRDLGTKGFMEYAAAHGSAEERDAVRHVVRIEAVDSPYEKFEIHTDYPRTAGAYAEGRAISAVFRAYQRARDADGGGRIAVYGADASVPLAYAVY